MPNAFPTWPLPHRVLLTLQSVLSEGLLTIDPIASKLDVLSFFSEPQFPHMYNEKVGT